MYEDWSRPEVELIVADYFVMLAEELSGRSFNKAQHNRALQQLLGGRSRGSIEFKHANISAVLIELGYPYVDGYKPRHNYQELLRDVVVDRLFADQRLEAAASAAVSAPTNPRTVASGDWTEVVVEAPTRDEKVDRSRERWGVPRPTLRGVNYLERESRNTSLGGAGEEFVLSLERMRLRQLGHRRLSEKVEHVARTQGDGLGYDILSFESNGRERLIEVKTTRYGDMTPFFATRNEVEVSERQAASYRLYRVFKFEKKPRLFILPGALRQSVILEPVTYRASLP
ncbi:MAG: DUF3883 domain-containing protein [Gemmatimonadetes bacterium]|nr:DUF3883 domain-containing protein [Gemmatimonadota bacterium]